MNAALHTEADAVARLAAARPLVIDVVPASEVSEHHANGGVTHAGPPIEPARMCPPMRAALGSALWLEGVAGTPAEAIALVEDGQIPLTDQPRRRRRRPDGGRREPEHAGLGRA